MEKIKCCECGPRCQRYNTFSLVLHVSLTLESLFVSKALAHLFRCSTFRTGSWPHWAKIIAKDKQFSDLYYKHITIVIDAASVISK